MSARKFDSIEACDRELDRIEDKELNAQRFHQSHKLQRLAKLREEILQRRVELQHGDLFEERRGA